MALPDSRVLDMIARRHGVHGPFTRATGGLNLVYLGPNAVIKRYPFPDPHEAEVEADALAALVDRTPIPVPRPLGRGEIDGVPYLIVTRLRGEPLRDVWPTLSRDRQLAVAHQIGAWMAALWTVPPPASVRDRHPDIDAWLATEWPNTRARHLAEGVPAEVLEDIPAWLSAQEPLAHAQSAFLHADLHDENLLCDPEGHLTGVLDLGDALAGGPAFDLVSPWLAPGLRSPEARRALLIGAGLGDDPQVRRAIATCALRHPWAELAPLGAFSDVPSLVARLSC